MPGTTPTTIQQPLEPSNDQPSDPSIDLLNIETNEDYLSVKKSLDILKRQLEKANEDVQVLNKVKLEALEDPYTFITNLKKKSKSNVPKLQKIISVPDIDWSKYRFLPESRLALQHAALNELTQQFIGQAKKSTYRSILDTAMATEYTSAPTTPVSVRNLQQELSKATQAMRQIPSRANSVSDFSEDDEEESVVSKTTPRSTLPYTPPININTHCAGKGIGKRRTSTVQTGIERNLQASSMEMSEPESPAISRLQSIEPRTPDDYSSTDANSMDDPNRAPTFKQPWSDEEQERLQQLLITYPDEPIQAQRFNKISKALGTRTPRQVASRVQKYFIKLAKLGLPVPGRITIPPSCMPKERGSSGKPKQKAKGTHQQGRVTKPAAGLNNRPYATVASTGYVRTSGAHYASAQGPPAVFMSDDEEDSSVQEMMRRTTNGNSDASDVIVHEGYACDGCGTEPIVGVLYKCTMCDISEEVDLCGNCMEKGTFTNDHHTADHTFEAVRTANPFPYYADNDYKSPEHLGEYSYLGF